MPSRSIGVQSWLRSHCEPQPVHANRGSGAPGESSGPHRQASWQAYWASGSDTHPSSPQVARRAGRRHDRGVDDAPERPDGGNTVRLTAFVRGDVQGVGFRWWTRSRALELGLAGHATNLPDGRVQVVAEGERSVCERLLGQLAEQPSTTRRPGRVSGVTEQWTAARGTTSGFTER